MNGLFKRSFRWVGLALTLLIAINSSSFLYDKLFSSRSQNWQLEMTEIGGMDGREDKFTLFSDGRIIYQGKNKNAESKISPENLDEISNRLAECDLPDSFSTSLPNLSNQTDQIGRNIVLSVDGEQYSQPDLMINPLRQISSIRLENKVLSVFRELKNKA